MLSIRLTLTLLICGVFAAGCDAGSPHQDASARQEAEGRSGVLISADDYLANSMSAYPEYGGHFTSRDGQNVIYITTGDGDASRSSANDIKSNLDAIYGSSTLASRRFSNAEIRDAAYSFRQLLDVKDRLTRDVLGRYGVSYVDLDEVNNAVNVGVRVGGDSEGVVLYLKSAGLGDIARVTVNADSYSDIWEGDTEVQARPPAPTLQARYRPLMGGIMYQHDGRDPCTITAVGTMGVNNVFVSNSHCTGPVPGSSVLDAFQPLKSSAPAAVGYRYSEANFTQVGGSCPSGALCRPADVVLYMVNGTQTQIRKGWIASSLYYISSPALPTYDKDVKILSEHGFPYPFPASFDPVVVLGSGSGRMQGTISQTCVSIDASGAGSATPTRANTCQYTYQANGSFRTVDSGAPVFWSSLNSGLMPLAPYSTYEEGILTGIHWTRSSSDPTRGAMSLWYYAETLLEGLPTSMGELDVSGPLN